MKKITFTMLLFTTISVQISFAQNSKTLDGIISQIEFKEDTVKAVFDWITANIRYDTKAISKTKAYLNSKKVKDKEARLKKILLTKKGVCQHYSELLDTLVKKLGYNSMVVSGYTRSPSTGKLSKIGHAWNVVEVNGKWILIDSTWGAGYVTENKRFKRHYKSEYYNSKPEQFIKSHMPHDPIWQLLTKPVTYNEFDKKKINVNSLEATSDYLPVNAYIIKNKVERLKESLARINQLGVANKFIKDYKDVMIHNLDVSDKNDNVRKYNDAVELHNKVVKEYKTYIDAKNKKAGAEYTKTDIQKWKDDIEKVIATYKTVKSDNPKQMISLKSAIDNAIKLKNSLQKILDKW